jgi:2-(1,2-epoxy-1,2-dihydrophenyl)acetyl-CoA isomerase
MSGAVKLSVADGIATITLNRPHVMNAMDGEMMRQLRPAAEAAERDAGVRAVVLRGEGAAFMAGGDIAVFHEHLAELPELIVSWGREMHAAFLTLRRMGKPVLASVHGAVAGAGFSLMCVADLAIAAADTRFTLAYANIGASPDGGSTYFLPRLVGYKVAMEMIMRSWPRRRCASRNASPPDRRVPTHKPSCWSISPLIRLTPRWSRNCRLFLAARAAPISRKV